MYRVSAIGFACIIVAACAGQVDYGHNGGVEYGRRWRIRRLDGLPRWKIRAASVVGRLCTVLAAKGSTATSSGIVRHRWSKPRWTIVRFSSKGAGPDGARPGARSSSAVADTGARLGGYPAPGVEEYRQEKSVASRGRGDLLSVAGGGPRFSRAGFSLRSGRGPSGCGE